MKNSKTIFDSFSEKFPILQRCYETYKLLDCLAKNNPDDTLRKSAEITLLEIIELVVIATRLDRSEKKSTLSQAERKIDILKVFIDMAKENGRLIGSQNIIPLNEKVEEISKMIGGWLKAVKGQDPSFEEEV